MEKFNLEKIWNAMLEQDDSRPLVKRDYMYASEIGASYIDRFLSMAAVPPSNPPNFRSLRKFNSGKMWEWIVWYVLERCGMVKKYQGGEDGKQKSIRYQLPGMLTVSGRLDILVGGKPDLKKGLKSHSDFMLPDFLDRAVEKFVLNLGITRDTITEVKSCSSNMFDVYEAKHKPLPSHVGQLKHYQLADPMPGCIIYICRDDCRLMHFHIEQDDPLAMEIYEKDVAGYSSYYYNNEAPPIEAPILFDKELQKFTLNWRIEYSRYLRLVYGYDEPINYREDWESKRDRWNRVVKKLKEGSKITPDNRSAMMEMDEYREEYIDQKRYFDMNKIHANV